ncbi:FAD binding domain-containing protein [Phlyctema vagabunda]|uniref:FAD binding domain-containing protein n=1 Tax=Phlyctema vagabunda TaxID=108571 RepID=A0ABR4PMV9_9HELO
MMFPKIVVSSVMVDTLGVENTPAFDKIQRTPAVMQDLKHRSLAVITTTYALPSGNRNI